MDMEADQANQPLLLNPFDETEVLKDHIRYLEIIRNWWADLNRVKELLGMSVNGDAVDWELVERARRLSLLLPIELWKAPTRGFGSVWDTWERDLLKGVGE